MDIVVGSPRRNRKTVRGSSEIEMQKSLSFILLFVLLSMCIPACGDSGTPPPLDKSRAKPIAIINGFLIDGRGGDPIAGAVIVVQGSLIEAVGTDSTLDIPVEALVIDAGGGYILPGLFNMHVHGGYDEGNLQEWAESGVTTVRDLGDFRHPSSVSYTMRNRFLEDNRNARLVAAGPIVTSIGGYGNYPVSSPTDAATKISGLIAEGADLIKIAIEDDLQGRRWPLLSLDEISTIVQTAHTGGLKVSAHVSRARHLERAIRGGVDDVNHMIVDQVPDSLITMMIAADISWIPTLELWKGVSERYNLSWGSTAKENLGRFVRAGGRVVVGTDFDGYVTHFDTGMPITEIRLMSEAGMTPMEIILAATSNAAFACGRDVDLGTVEPGKIADLIIMPGNPLDDLDYLLEIHTVFHNGVVITG